MVWLAGLAQLASAYFISIDANEEQCFFDRVSSGVKMGLMFEVKHRNTSTTLSPDDFTLTSM